MQLKQEIETLKERVDAAPRSAAPAERYVSADGNLLVGHAEPEPDDYPDVEEQAAMEVAPAAQDDSLSINEKKSELIEKALEKYHGNRKQAAAELGISERTLYRKIKELGL